VQRGIDRRELEHRRGLRACRVMGSREPHDALGESASLVGAQDIHAAQVLDGVQPPHQHAAASHHLGAAGEVHAEDGREQLGAEADGERD